jgi:hypothetical protein
MDPFIVLHVVIAATNSRLIRHDHHRHVGSVQSAYRVGSTWQKLDIIRP